MALATPSDLTKRFDVRKIRQLASDTNAPISEGAVATDPNVLEALADAGGQVLAAMLRGGRYTEAQLAALTGDSLSYLKRLVCTLAMGNLTARRGYSEGELAAQVAGYGWAHKQLELLGDGVQVLNVDLAIAAGKPRNVQIDRQKTLITAAGRRVFGDLTTDYSEAQPKQPGYGA